MNVTFPTSSMAVAAPRSGWTITSPVGRAGFVYRDRGTREPAGFRQRIMQLTFAPNSAEMAPLLNFRCRVPAKG